MKPILKFFKVAKEEKTFVNDHRSAKRYELPLKLNYHDPLTNYHGESLTRDISKNGLRFPVDTKIPKGTILDLKVEDPNSHTSICSKAKVVWLEKIVTGDDAEDVVHEVGVKFLKKKLY